MTDVASDFDLIALHPNGCAQQITGEMYWSSTTSFEVEVDVENPADPGRPCRWIVARSLLAAGLTGPAGQGDVALMPHLHNPAYVELVLSSPSGRVALLVDLVDLELFLASTYRHVPADAEFVDVPETAASFECPPAA